MTENNIGKNLKYLRKKNGLTQQNIRARLGITRSTWSNYENGLTTPSINDLINFSRYFGITMDELILQDLNAQNPLPVRTSKVVRSQAVYPMNDALSATAEPHIMYVINELKRLREEIDTIKRSHKD